MNNYELRGGALTRHSVNQLINYSVNDFKLSMIQLTTFSNKREFIFPAFRIIIFLSAVKIRKGRIKEFTGNEPEMKSELFNGIANRSVGRCEVIWQSIISFPLRSDKTNAGRLLLPDKSEKGNGITTISPLTNLSMRGLLQELTNLLTKHVRLQDMAQFDRLLLCLRERRLRFCALTPMLTARRLLIFLVLSMFPLSDYFWAQN
jgi:hypothetical protein